MTDITHPTDENVAAGDAPADDAHDEHHGPTDRIFILTFFALAVITAVEVLVSYVDIGIAFLPILLGLMVVKFFTVVLVFMHVKYDNKLFGQLFYIGLVLALAVYLITLFTFRFFET